MKRFLAVLALTVFLGAPVALANDSDEDKDKQTTTEPTADPNDGNHIGRSVTTAPRADTLD